MSPTLLKRKKQKENLPANPNKIQGIYMNMKNKNIKIHKNIIEMKQ